MQLRICLVTRGLAITLSYSFTVAVKNEVVLLLDSHRHENKAVLLGIGHIVFGYLTKYTVLSLNRLSMSES